MAYTPINWQTGDTITAEKLNKCDNGWSVESSFPQLFSETVTTAETNGVYAATFAYATQITADTLIVTLNGTEYTCSKYRDENNFGPQSFYGGFGSEGPDFTTYPFYIMAQDEGLNMIATAAEGTYTVVAVGVSETIDVSNNFKSAVASASLVLNDTDGYLDKTWQEIFDAVKAGFNVVIYRAENDTLYGIKQIEQLSIYVGFNRIYHVSVPTDYPTTN